MYPPKENGTPQLDLKRCSFSILVEERSCIYFRRGRFWRRASKALSLWQNGVRDDEVDKEDAEDMDVDAEPIALAIDEVPTERAPPNGIKDPLAFGGRGVRGSGGAATEGGGAGAATGGAGAGAATGGAGAGAGQLRATGVGASQPLGKRVPLWHPSWCSWSQNDAQMSSTPPTPVQRLAERLTYPENPLREISRLAAHFGWHFCFLWYEDGGWWKGAGRESSSHEKLSAVESRGKKENDSLPSSHGERRQKPELHPPSSFPPTNLPLLANSPPPPLPKSALTHAEKQAQKQASEDLLLANNYYERIGRRQRIHEYAVHRHLKLTTKSSLRLKSRSPPHSAPWTTPSNAKAAIARGRALAFAPGTVEGDRAWAYGYAYTDAEAIERYDAEAAWADEVTDQVLATAQGRRRGVLEDHHNASGTSSPIPSSATAFSVEEAKLALERVQAIARRLLPKHESESAK
ncbi:hypothetical protein C8F04DRAFT_1197874 [Mycena alexandri]|uniref:Uncharacterized protein n=1 Tax=Mycena alexandri TaxID=1745969 RepID=A0AAD6S1N6_9AGAR|nr:hypothetical protein C8F04DRAFT_1197874 [Mycena alexandri]